MNRIFIFHDNGIKVFLYHQLLLIAAFFLSTAMLVRPLFAQAKEDAEIKQILNSKNTPQQVTLDTLTEERAIELALERSRELQSLNTNVQIANYRLDSSGKISNPVLRISDASTKYYTDEFDELRVGFRWRLPKIGELAEEKQQAQVEVWERKVTAIRFRQQLITKVRHNYATVIMHDSLVELAQKRISLEDKRINIIENMVDTGNRSIVYFTKAKIWHTEAKNDYARIVLSRNETRRKLARRTGMPVNIPLSINNLPEITQDLDQLIAIAFKNRPEIDLVQQRIQLAVKQYDLEHRKIIPWPTFFDLSYHIENDPREDWGELRLGINVPVFNLNRGNIKATDLAIKNKEGEFDAIRENIEGEVRDAYTIYIDLLLDWKNFSRDAEKLISDVKNLVEQAKKHQTLLPDEVLEMELTSIETQKILYHKRRDLAHALIDLYFALGIESSEQLSEPGKGKLNAFGSQ